MDKPPNRWANHLPDARQIERLASLFPVLRYLAGSALQKPLLAEPSAKVVEADMVANQAEAVLAAIRADLLPHILDALWRYAELIRQEAT